MTKGRKLIIDKVWIRKENKKKIIINFVEQDRNKMYQLQEGIEKYT